MPREEALLADLYALRPIPVDALRAALFAAARAPKPSDLATVEAIAKNERYLDGIFLGQAAVWILPAWGTLGIKALTNIFDNGWWSDEAIAVLIQAAASRQLSFEGAVSYESPPGTEAVAESALQDIAANAASNASAFRRLYKAGMLVRWHTFEHVVGLLTGARLVVNERTLSEFQAIIDREDTHEEEIHRFLAEHPTLLDPLAQQIWTKHELGDDFITDFVLRRINNDYVLVEIERATHKIFTQAGVLAAAANTALAQVRDFQRWVAANIAYAQRKLPGINRPEGLVVVGRRGSLSGDDKERLAEENFSRRGQGRIVTFDDLIEQARTVRSNLFKSPRVVRSAEQPRLSSSE